ncbi:MAG: ABC transporter substrate-binding protein [bacterium]
MLKIWSLIKKTISEIRDFFWFYPYFFTDHTILSNSSLIWKWYMRARPFSIIISILIIFSALFMTLSDFGLSIVNHSSTMIEGLVKEPGFNGTLLVNPIIGNSNEINKSLSKIIYESLFNILPNGDIKPQLAKSFTTSADSKTLSIALRDDVYWHDGVKFTSDDVIETYRRLKNTGSENNIAAQTIKDKEIKKLDDYNLEIIKTKVDSNFLELINIGIMPKHILESVTVNKLENHPLNRDPIGTGPYKLLSSNEDKIVLVANYKYYLGKPKEEYYQLNLYKTEKDAVIALKSGQIHIFNNLSQNFIADLNANKNITLQKSIPIYRQYWALYFNLDKKDTVYSNLEVRQAVAHAINKNELINKLGNLASVALSTIPLVSWVEPKGELNYDKDKASKILETNGWVVNNKTSAREKNGKEIELNITYLDSDIKKDVVESIKSDLESIGIRVNLVPKNSTDIKEVVIPNRSFDVLLYGVETSNDPDRIRFWHEDAITYPGLNLSGYRSSVKIKDPVTGNRTSRLNDALEKALGTEDRVQRKDQYEAVVKILDTEVPAVFLYYPIMTSAINTRVLNFDISTITLPENRYTEIGKWEIKK